MFAELDATTIHAVLLEPVPFRVLFTGNQQEPCHPPATHAVRDTLHSCSPASLHNLVRVGFNATPKGGCFNNLRLLGV